MEKIEWKWKTSDGLEMYSQAWEPEGRGKGVVCLVHGLGEHSGRYTADGEALTRAGYVLAGFDLRGFGRSEGVRGHTPSLEAYFDDMDLFLAEIARRYPNLPTFLYGGSMGGLLVLAYTPLRKPTIAGAIAAAPSLISAIEKEKGKVMLAKVMGKLVPTFSKDSGLETSLLCRDSKAIENHINDPLVHRRVTASWGLSMFKAIRLAFENASNFPSPLLLMHGTKDEIAYPIGSQKFADLAPKDKVTLKMLEGFPHDLHEDTGKAEVFKVMIDWLNEILG